MPFAQDLTSKQRGLEVKKDSSGELELALNMKGNANSSPLTHLRKASTPILRRAGVKTGRAAERRTRLTGSRSDLPSRPGCGPCAQTNFCADNENFQELPCDMKGTAANCAGITRFIVRGLSGLRHPAERPPVPNIYVHDRVFGIGGVTKNGTPIDL